MDQKIGKEEKGKGKEEKGKGKEKDDIEVKKEVSIIVAGSVDSGKSTFIGVMATGKLDDGKGLARSFVAKHQHELDSGKTSDIAVKTIVVDKREISLIDLCGHEKYLKTTLFGITGYFPDYAILIVSANRGLVKMTKEHLGILLYMKIPFIILVTRIDVTPDNIYKNTMHNINIILKKYKREPTIITTLDDVNLGPDELKMKELEHIDESNQIAKLIHNNHYIVPIVTISCKTGYYVDLMKNFIAHLEPRGVWNQQQTGSVFYIDSKFTPPGIGLVVSGIVKGNTIYNNSELLIGPYQDGFKRVKVWSMHNNTRGVVHSLQNRQRGCLAIKSVGGHHDLINKYTIRRGMVIVSPENELNICMEFKAHIEILNHSTVISQNYSPVIHCGTVRQAAKIMLDKDIELKMGSKANVSFKFLQNPEYIEKDSIFFFREGTTRGVGVITDIVNLPCACLITNKKVSTSKSTKTKNAK